MNHTERGRRRSSGHLPIETIGTHNGKFHADEVLACFMLKQLPEFSNAQIIRTRDEAVLKTCDIVVDVGGEFDPAKKRFDHHQKSFNESMSTLIPGKKWTIKLSSAGLVYAFYGQTVLAKILDKNVHDESISILYDKIYEDFIQEIDAIDNGIGVSDHPLKYRITTNLSNRVSYLNPSWRDGDNCDDWPAFQNAMKMVGTEFTQRVHYYAGDWLESYMVVKTAVEARFETDESGEIIELPSGGVAWKDHLVKLEKDLEIETPIKFVLFPDKNIMWRIQCVPIAPESFSLRNPLKEEWRGLRDKELEEISRIPTIQFVHANGFIGGALEKEDVLRMAHLSLNS